MANDQIIKHNGKKCSTGSELPKDFEYERQKTVLKLFDFEKYATVTQLIETQ